MSDIVSPTLLPEGLRDVLPPDAAIQAALVERLAASFEANGYERVSPPLVEFENTLLAGMGAATADRIFRMVDPISQRTLGLRADVTAQIARIASTRLQSSTRPLRLMYAGQVMRVKGHQLRPERQFTQVGFELIGPDTVAADVEAIVVATESIAKLGVNDITVNLALPSLVPAILGRDGFEATHLATLLQALDHKDVAEIRLLAGTHTNTLVTLVEATGSIAIARERLSGVVLPSSARAQLESLYAVADQIKNQAPDISLTLDLVESRGLQYHTGLTLFIFAKGSAREIGRGGRYEISHDGGQTEPATGVTLFLDGLIPVVPLQEPKSCVFISYGTDRKSIVDLQAKGYRTKLSLQDTSDIISEAIRLGCSHVFVDGSLQSIAHHGKAK